MVFKVCFVGTEISPSNGEAFVGGHVNTAVRLSKGLSRLGWEVHIVTTPARFSRGVKFDFPWAKMHFIDVGGQYSSLKYGADFLIKGIRTVEFLDRKESFNIIHTHSGFFSIATIPVLLKKRLGMPALHSLYCPASFFPTKTILDKFGIKILSAGLDKIVAVSTNVKNSLIRCGVKEDKIEVIPPCFDPDVFNPSVSRAERCNFKVNSETQMVLFVGNVDEAKGLDIFLNVAELVLHRYRRVKIVIALHEPYEIIQNVRVIASRKLGSHVTVMGVVRSMPELIASADVLVVPFRSTKNVADIPLIILEAMAIGRPVIASKVGGIKEIIHDNENGVLVEPNQADLLADAIVNLLGNLSLRKEIGERSISSVNTKFSYMEVSRKLSNLYLKIFKGPE
jgi:glycosyltransferase involved in cell wall biosynthesis